MKNHQIVCLCGSTKKEWKEQYAQVNRQLTLRGYAVISVGVFKDDVKDIEVHRDLLESIHYQKIMMSDFVVLIHKDAIGKHTKEEMDFAKKVGKLVFDYESFIKDRV